MVPLDYPEKLPEKGLGSLQSLCSLSTQCPSLLLMILNDVQVRRLGLTGHVVLLSRVSVNCGGISFEYDL